jgi:hypothetical protein
MATVGRRVSERSSGGSRTGMVGVVLAMVAVVGLVAGIVLTRGDGDDPAGRSAGQAAGAPAGQAAGQASGQAGGAAAGQPAGSDGLLRPTLQCPGHKVKTVEARSRTSSADTPTAIARRWLAGKGEGQPKGLKPSTFRVIVPGGPASTTAQQGYLMLLDRDQFTVALLQIHRARSGGGWLTGTSSTCA